MLNVKKLLAKITESIKSKTEWNLVYSGSFRAVGSLTVPGIENAKEIIIEEYEIPYQT